MERLFHGRKISVRVEKSIDSAADQTKRYPRDPHYGALDCKAGVDRAIFEQRRSEFAARVAELLRDAARAPEQYGSEYLERLMSDTFSRQAQIEGEVERLLNDWSEVEVSRHIFCTALDLLSVEPVSNLQNKWSSSSDPIRHAFREEISNDVYSMSISYQGNGSGGMCYVSYSLRTNSPIPASNVILRSVDRKRFPSEEEANRYIKGRKDWATRLFFSEQRPKVVKNAENAFSIDGCPLPGFQFKEGGKQQGHAPQI